SPTAPEHGVTGRSRSAQQRLRPSGRLVRRSESQPQHPATEETMSYLGMKQLLEAGVHFGHETKRCNPKMKRYIFAERNGIFIIDLQKTLVESEKAFDFLRDVAGRGGTILFVGAKKRAQEMLAAEAKRSGMPYINERWLGGLLTNFKTMRTRVERLKDLETMFGDESILRFSKKEQIDLGKELSRLQRYLGGIKEMTRLPDALFIIDPTKEAIRSEEHTAEL